MNYSCGTTAYCLSPENRPFFVHFYSGVESDNSPNFRAISKIRTRVILNYPLIGGGAEPELFEISNKLERTVSGKSGAVQIIAFFKVAQNYLNLRAQFPSKSVSS